MKKTAYYYLSLAAIVAGGLVSCQDENQGFTKEEISYAKFEKEYNENFEREYGKIAPGHTWGFGSVRTRAVNDLSIDLYPDESNQYRITRNTDGSAAKAAHIGGGSGNDDDWYATDFVCQNAPAPITDEERAYVRQYVIDHPDDYVTTCPLNNYFIQNLNLNPHSGIQTYKADANGNYIHNGNSNNSSYQKGNVVNNEHMDQLTFDKVHFESYNNSTGYDYYVTNTAVFDPFYLCSDNGDLSLNRYKHWQTNTWIINDKDTGIQANDNDEFYVKDGTWWLNDQDLEIPAGVTNPNGYTHIGKEVHNAYRYYMVPGYGFYLCFDYSTHGQNGSYYGDGLFDDWILKLSPGLNEKYRVFCEDLGSTLDLDFNDLVFDYCVYKDLGKISIEIKSLGGTLPITFAGKDLKGDDLTANLNITNYVGSETLNDNIPLFYIEETSIENVEIEVDNDMMGKCFIANTPGKAPYLLRVMLGTEWPAENERIEHKHSGFSDFVIEPAENPFWWGNTEDYPDITPN